MGGDWCDEMQQGILPSRCRRKRFKGGRSCSNGGGHPRPSHSLVNRKRGWLFITGGGGVRREGDVRVVG